MYPPLFVTYIEDHLEIIIKLHLKYFTLLLSLFIDEYCSSEQPFPSDVSSSNLPLICSPKHKPQASSSANNNASESRYYHPPCVKNNNTRKSISRKRVTGNDQNPSSHFGVGSGGRISRVNNFMDSNQSHDIYQGV